ncbi:hypothetical protein MK489_02760 [Myxococcota bacterium]|nr:hypothetical protein [Myxococcota bacterium]
MEDRVNPVLYLELCDLDPDDYNASRTPEVLRLPSIERGSVWRNLHYQRKDFEPDFVFRVEDFRTLAVFEAGGDFRAPTAPDGIRGLHFLHTPRPGQGFLTGAPTLGLMLVLISAREASGAQTLRDWADFVHLPPLATGELGFSMITPYRNAANEEPLFMHFYETVGRDAEAALQAEVHDFPARYGGVQTEAYRHWQVHDQLVVDYINTFERVI